MHRRESIALFALTLWTLSMHAGLLAGQALPVGKRVRLTLADASTYAGRLDSAQDARIWLSAHDIRGQAVELGRVRRIEVSRGRKPNWLLGAGLGAVGGLVTGLVLKNVIEPDVESGDDAVIRAAYLGAGTLGGALMGAGLSLVLAPEHWDAVPQDRWVRPEPPQSRHAVRAWQFGLRLTH